MSSEYKLNFTHMTSYDEHDVFSHVPALCNPMDSSFPKQPKTRFTVFSVFTIKNAQIKTQISLFEK